MDVNRKSNGQNEQSAPRISAPKLSAPKGGGAVQGLGESFESQAFSGTAGLSVPIPAPPARGMTPELSVSYSSAGGNGVFGMGFALGLSNISRKTSTGIPRYDGTDVFVFADEGDLVPALDWDENRKKWITVTRAEPPENPEWEVQTYRPRREEAFDCIERWTSITDGQSHWRVLTKSNVVHILGQTKQARIFDSQYPTRIFQWLIEETRDAHGNKILYHYKSAGADESTATGSQAGRNLRSNRYIDKIEYGNYSGSDGEVFAFRIRFDYGEPSDDGRLEPGAPVIRSDSFSSYRSGFEIRTLWRCSNVFVYHCFHDRFDGQPVLTGKLHFDYQQASGLSVASQPATDLSFLHRVNQIGFRKDAQGNYQSKPKPAMQLTYSPFEPASQTYQQMQVDGGGSIPGSLRQGQFLPLDLQGEGLEGLLYSDSATTLYWQPLGDGHYSVPLSPAEFPIVKDLNDTDLTITSLEANGEQNLLVRASALSGFYKSEGTGRWKSFQPFESAPADLVNPSAEFVDMDGSGRADLVVFDDRQLKTYPSLGLKGYGAADIVPQQSNFPLVRNDWQEELLTFADIFGDGLSHRVRIRSGLVECWANLGYGHFGEKVVLANAPAFDNRFDASRLFLSDIDGSGTVDLIYVSSDHFRVYFNKSGNGFSEPLTIPLPAPYDDLSQISFADVNGNGTTCLILTRVTPDVTHYYYDFAGAQKPYMLTGIDNGLGSNTKIHYTTSVRQYLEDKRQGRPWVTRMFFPVQVVEKIERFEQITGARYVTQYKYHDGYYDPQEREFRGFGYVETWDTEEYEKFVEAEESDIPFDNLNNELYVAPAYSRAWYQTGAYTEAGELARQYAEEYWKGDPDALNLPPDVLSPEIGAQDAETIRQAYAAMAGQMLRQEVYGLDDSPDVSNPYTVSENNVKVRLVQPREGQPYAVFLTSPRESLTYNYERQPLDPRIEHQFTLLVDDFGNVRRSCSVAYPRRSNAGATIFPEQSRLQTVVMDTEFINHPETKEQPYRWIGVGFENREYQLEGLSSGANGYFSFAEIDRQVSRALENPLAYDQPFSPETLQSRLFSWSRSYFWNETQTEALLPEQIAFQGLLHHEEVAVLTSKLVQDAFGDRVTPEILSQDGGYFNNLIDHYWWNRGLIQYYCWEPAQFYLPRQTDGLFAGVDSASNLNPTTITAYDQYYLLPTRLDTYLTGLPDENHNPPAGAVVLSITAENDYQALQPWRLTDVNQNVTEVMFDPLAKVIVNTLYGTTEGQPAGDLPLADYKFEPAANSAEVIENPGKFLQGATTYTFYDMSAWNDRKQPASVVELHRDKHVHQLPSGEQSQIQISIAYSDGFGRAAETKLLTEPGPVARRDEDGNIVRDKAGKILCVNADQRWIVSGRTVYNNKGEPAEQYQPYFSPTPDYENQTQITEQGLVPPPTVLHYDPLTRLVRTDTPKGFFKKTEYFSWQTKKYDENDTVKDSEFYKNFPANPVTPGEKSEKIALEKAAAFYNTPAVEILDSLGRTVRSLENNLGAVRASDFNRIVQGSGITAQKLWDQLVGQGYLKPDGQQTDAAWVTEKVQPYEKDFQAAFKVEYKELAAPILNLLKENGLTTLRVLDIKGREIRSIDPRLFYSNVTGGTDYFNFTHLFDMADNVLITNSADAGLNQSLDNIFGSHFWNWSARNFEQAISFDRLQRRAEVRVKAFKNDGTLVTDSLVEVYVYGESRQQPENFNLRGQLYKLQDQSGVIINSLYDIQGDLQETTRQLTVNYKEGINWAEDVPLEPEPPYKTRFSNNVFRRLLSETTPDGSVTAYTYNQAGLLSQVAVTFKDGAPQPVVRQIQYDANSQRLFIDYANGVTTTYDYERTTLRLLTLNSVRSGTNAKTEPRTNVLQNIEYTYDPVGNITRTVDSTYQTVFFNNQKVEPVSDYTYDALYRLIQANGRQHAGINAATYRNNASAGDFKQSKYFALPNDGNALENYQESYTYDDAGNLLTTKHTATNSWSRVNEIMPDSNRLKTTGAKNGIVYSNPISYDNSGNQKQLNINNPVELYWNCCENLISARLIERPDEPDDSDYYTYDSDDLRTRKVSERLASGGAVIQKETKVYLGNYEVKLLSRETGNAETPILKRQTLRVMDDKTCVATINYWEQDDLKREVDQPGTRQFRYQLDNRLGSVSMEVDDAARLISYEEYFPYGGTAFIAGKNQTEVKLKDYRYSGKERDDSTGLYYYGARYYAPWLGRWLKPDPAGIIDGLNLYAFVGGNPISFVDVRGYTKRKLNSDTLVTVQNYQGVGNGSQKRRAIAYAQTPNVPHVALEVNSNVEPPPSLGNHQLLNSLGEANPRGSMNYLAPQGSRIMTNLVPPADILADFKSPGGALNTPIHRSVTTINGIHGSKSRRTSRRLPVSVPIRNNHIRFFAIHSRSSSGSERARAALVATAFALRDLDPGKPFVLAGDLNQDPVAVQNMIDALPAPRNTQIRVSNPGVTTHLTRSTGVERTLDFAITNVVPLHLGVSSTAPSRRGGKGGRPDHGRLTVRISKKPNSM